MRDRNQREAGRRKSRVKKGEYGCRDHRKRMLLLQICLDLAVIAILLLLRPYAGKNVSVILTVMAVLAVLPMANTASPLLASWKYKTGPGKDHERLSKACEGFLTAWDLIVTSKEDIMPVEAAVFHPSGTYLYVTEGRADIKRMEAFLSGMLKTHRLNPSVKIFTEERAFLGRLAGLKTAGEDAVSDQNQVRQLFLNLSM